MGMILRWYCGMVKGLALLIYVKFIEGKQIVKNNYYCNDVALLMN